MVTDGICTEHGPLEIQCQAITNHPSAYASEFLRGGHQCTRRATYTNGSRYLCSQHVKEPATVLTKATRRPMPGYRRLAGVKRA